jgi:hypothetical protein
LGRSFLRGCGRDAGHVDSPHHECPDDRRRGLLPGLGRSPPTLREVTGSGANAGLSAMCSGSSTCSPSTRSRPPSSPSAGSAERYPQRRGARRRCGPRAASHGYGHQRVSDLTRDEFDADIRRAKAILEDLSKVEVLGYRAPSFSIGATNLWALESLARQGFATARASIRSDTTTTACPKHHASLTGSMPP